MQHSKARSYVDKAFELDSKGLSLQRGLSLAAVMLLPLIVLGLIHKPEYWLSVSFGALFVGLSDPGGSFTYRLIRMAGFAVIGAVLTILALGIGKSDWEWMVLAVFVATLLGGLALTYGQHRLIAGLFLNVWFLIELTLPAAYQASHVALNPWAQGLAWLAGSALVLVYAFIVWMARGRTDEPLPGASVLPRTSTRVPLTAPLIVFIVARALAVGISAAIAFGLHLPNADWMPLATLVAMKTNFEQSTLVAGQRVAGTVIGAGVAAFFLLTVSNQTVLAVVIIILAAAAGIVRLANYLWYCAAVAAVALIGMDLPHPTNLTEEGRRILFTFIGVAIAVAIMLLLGVLQKSSATRREAHSH